MPDNQSPSHPYEVAIIGAGPIGIELAVAFTRLGVDYIHFDAGQIGHTISWWPRNTYFFSTTERIEIAGIPSQAGDQPRITGEQYLAYLRGIVEQFDLKVNTYEPVIDIQKTETGFNLITNPLPGRKSYSTKKVVIAFGDMHKPRLLGIPGEDLPHVSHYLHDPHDYFRKRLLVVGGRNSAVESALRCWRMGAEVAISYRRPAFNEQIVKATILPDLLTQIERGNIQFYPKTIPIEITAETVHLTPASSSSISSSRLIKHQADFVLLHTGFVQDSSLFERTGVKLKGTQKVPVCSPETMESNISGLYIAGTAAAGTQKRFRLFIENCHVHVAKITSAITGQVPEKIGTIPTRKYDLPFNDYRDN